jgi:hypothetical protein
MPDKSSPDGSPRFYCMAQARPQAALRTTPRVPARLATQTNAPREKT